MSIHSIITNVTEITNKDEITKTDILRLLRFVERLQIFGCEEDRVNRLLKARRVMIPCVRDYFKNDGYIVRTIDAQCFYYEQMWKIVDFVKHVLKCHSCGIVIYSDIEKQFYETFYEVYTIDFFFTASVLFNPVKRLGLKSIQTMIDMLSYGMNVKPVKFVPAYTHFTCILKYYTEEEATFVMEYRNGLREEVRYTIESDGSSFSYKTL